MNTDEAQAKLAEAKAVIEQAEAEDKNLRRAGLIAKLAQVRTDLRAARQRYASLRAGIYEAREQRGNAQAKVKRVLEALHTSNSERPEVADVLPDDPEVVAWRKGHDALDRKLAAAIAARDALPDPQGPDFTEACTYEGPYGTIATLQFAEQNLLRALQGRAGRVRFEGGVFRVP